jgi:hypothetical protein
MVERVLFIATLHHPEQLAAERAARPDAPPLFPTSMSQHFLVRALERQGLTCAVFWRNLPGFGRQDIAALRMERFSEGITPSRVLRAALDRIPPRASPDIRQRNAALLSQARAFAPDVLWMVGDNRVIFPETLAAIKRETGARLVYATGTSPIVFSHAIEREAARLIDLVLVNDYYHGMQWLELGARALGPRPVVAIDPAFHQPRALPPDEQARYRADVTFAGTVLPEALYSQRIAALRALRDVVDLAIWTVHDVPADLRPYVRGSALGDQMLRVLSGATIALNVHGDFMRHGGNMRLFEAAGVGAFQLADDLPAVREWFPAGTIATFSGLDDLVAQVQHYLAHPDERDRIAAAGRAHVLRAHSYDARVAALLPALALDSL